jgi:transaldolase
MDIFLDTASLEAIDYWRGHGLVDGVTTNPTILLKEGGPDLEGRIRAIAELVDPLPVSVEVYANDHEEMLSQARRFAAWAPNIVIKIPIINEAGESSLDVVKALTDSGIRVNVTACLSFGQVVGGAKAGAAYISLFAGRIADEGGDAPGLIRDAVGWLKLWDYRSKIIVGSIRGAIDVQQAALAGAHVITIPPPFLAKFLDHQYSRATVRQFNEDARATLDRLADFPLPAAG